MDPKKTGSVLAVVAVLVGGLVVAIENGKADPETKDVKALAQAKVDGDVKPYSVYSVDRSDGGKLFVALSKEQDAGDKAVFIDHSPCALRPLKTDPALCVAVLPDGGTVDPGDENVMQDGQWLGVGCVEAPCVIMLGDEAPK